ncbi:MAG: 23S rRNA (uracil(1939)-C(5))-methyltransferase RlmD [Bacillota bacterium]
MTGNLAEVTGLNHRGEGVGRVLQGPDRGLVVFLSGTVPGDVVQYSVIERKKGYLRGRLVKVLESGPGRVGEICAVGARCGGCTWQHMEYDLQLQWKRKIVLEALSRIARIRDLEVRPCIPSPEIFGYRNKVEVPVSIDNGQIVAGFYEPYTHRVVPSENCALEHPLAREVVSILVGEIRNRNYSVYNERTGRGLVRHVVARVAPSTGERMAVLVVNGRAVPGESDLAAHLVRSLPGLQSVVLNINTERTNIILGERQRVLSGRPYIQDVLGSNELGHLKFRISAHSFYQVNSRQAVRLYQEAFSAARITPDDVVYDVYSGIGTITLFAARRSAFAVGIEEVRSAVVDAKKNAQVNGIDNVRFIQGKAEKVLPALVKNTRRPPVVILDPPRGGADERALIAISKFRPRAIVYVSCNPATLARDLITLTERGWVPQFCQPIDMFPVTPQPGCHLCVPFPEN